MIFEVDRKFTDYEEAPFIAVSSNEVCFFFKAELNNLTDDELIKRVESMLSIDNPTHEDFERLGLIDD